MSITRCEAHFVITDIFVKGGKEKTSIIHQMMVMVSCILGVLLAMAHVGHSKPFSYMESTTNEYYGVEDWDLVEKEEYYFDWDRFYDGNNDENQCKWRTDEDGHSQGPIDLDDWDTCDEGRDDKAS